MIPASPVALVIAAVALGAVVLGLLVLLLVVAVDSARRAARARRTRRLTPRLHEILDGDPVPRPRGRADAVRLGEMAAEMAMKVRGTDREALADWLRTSGYAERAERAMSSSRPTRRAEGIALALALADDGKPSRIIGLLRDPHPRVRAAAARGLGLLGRTDAVADILRAALGFGRAVTLSAASMAIVRARPRSALVLEPAWDSGDPRVVRLAVEVAGHLGLVHARERIEEALGSRDPALRAAAIPALRRLGDERSIPALTRAGRATTDERERELVLAALSSLGTEPAAPPTPPADSAPPADASPSPPAPPSWPAPPPLSEDAP